MKVRVDDFTMLIPTYNRPRLLANALRNYTAGVDFKIVVGDSSVEEAQVQNAEAIAACDARITHVRYPPETLVCDKLANLTTFVETPFAMYMADDDVALLDGVFASLEFLKANADFVACHGTYYRASLRTAESLAMDTEYATVSIDSATPVERIFALVTRYQAISYSVQRRETLLAGIIAPGLEDHFGELFNAFAIVICGKVGALATPYIIRNGQLGFRYDFLCDGNNFILHDSQRMAEGYQEFRRRVEPLLAPFALKRSAEHLIDLAYATFWARSFNLGSVVNALEKDGDIGTGSALFFAALEARTNAAAAPPERVNAIVRDFLRTGWPIFG